MEPLVALDSLGTDLYFSLEFPPLKMPMPLIVLCLALLMACDGLEYLTGPGDPVPLTPQSLEGSWVRVRAVISTLTSPVLSDTTDIPENGLIYELSESGEAKEFCRCPSLATAPSSSIVSYSVAGDTLRLQSRDGWSLSYLAEVTTRRLVLRAIGTFPHDIDEDGVAEDVRVTYTHQRKKD